MNKKVKTAMKRESFRLETNDSSSYSCSILQKYIVVGTNKPTVFEMEAGKEMKK